MSNRGPMRFARAESRQASAGARQIEGKRQTAHSDQARIVAVNHAKRACKGQQEAAPARPLEDSREEQISGNALLRHDAARHAQPLARTNCNNSTFAVKPEHGPRPKA